ncbi:MAG TPA: right-handed parallel beta-helix repeat-containing protein, partial [Anaerolineae bacterium]|nr:right-handed parallel beta-helix repeat-containing protein [Anaerolineae bacterium]
MRRFTFILIITTLLTLFIKASTEVAFTADSATPAAIFTVNSDSDEGDYKSVDGICQTTIVGECTLRAAIEQANASGVAATILFDYDSMQGKTLIPATPYPTISVPLSVDARKAGVCGNDPEAPPELVLTIDGSSAGFASGLQFGLGSDGSQVYGLIIGNFTYYGINISESDNAIIACNYIGVDKSGNSAIGNQQGGIKIYYADGTQIGLSAPKDRNLISGNGLSNSDGAGILINGTSDGTVIRTNVIGMNATGGSALANRNGIIVDIVGQTATIGGGSDVSNLISGNADSGIRLIGGATLIKYNYIGTNRWGSSARPNGTGILVASNGNTAI